MKNLFFCTLIALSAPAAMASRTAYDELMDLYETSEAISLEIILDKILQQQEVGVSVSTVPESVRCFTNKEKNTPQHSRREIIHFKAYKTERCTDYGELELFEGRSPFCRMERILDFNGYRATLKYDDQELLVKRHRRESITYKFVSIEGGPYLLSKSKKGGIIGIINPFATREVCYYPLYPLSDALFQSN